MDLKVLVFAPLIFSLIFLLPIFSGRSILIRRIAKTLAGIHFLYSLMFLVFFDNSQTYNYPTELTFMGQKWFGSLGISLSMGLDGISLLFVLLTSFLIFIACLASKGAVNSKHSLYYALIFILETALLGVFSSTDMFEFFMYWEMELIPMYFLISLWGSGNAKKSAMKFLLYTFIGSLFMLCGFLMLYNFNFISTSQLTADISSLKFDYDNAPMYLQIVTSILILIGFAVKLPIVPLHSWLPSAHVDAPTPVSMLLAGVLLKMGAYGIMRFNIQMLSDAFLILVPYIAILAFINVVYAAILAYYQVDIKKIVAYSSISSMGLVLLGLCSSNSIGICGAVILMLAHGIISAGLFFVVGIIHKRTGTRQLVLLSGIASVMPRLAGFTLILVLASIGVPLLMSFPGEFLIFFGALISSLTNNYLIQVVALSSIIILVLAACYLMKLMHGVFYQELSEQYLKLKDVTVNEFIVLFTLSLIVIVFGILPMSIIDIISPYINVIVEAFGG
ncbi:NADH-quinone oxidoreductase subunit M [bacterium]|nr:NADH-quinone oxidoreductase subunit M [bacterium]